MSEGCMPHLQSKDILYCGANGPASHEKLFSFSRKPRGMESEDSSLSSPNLVFGHC